MRPSPQPTASRLFTVLLTVLLVSSLAAPFAAGPVAADDDDGTTFAYYCEPLEVGVTDPMCERTTTSVSSDETIMHSTATAEAEGMDSHYTGLDNHLQDTNTIASLEARHAIATAWEEGDSESEAYQAALEAIRDYYATHQINHVEQKAKASVQYANVVDAAEADEDASDSWVSTGVDGSTGAGSGHLTSNQTTSYVELTNGEEYEFNTAYLELRTWSTNPDIDNENIHKIPHNMAHPEVNYGTDTASFGMGDDVPSDGHEIQQERGVDPNWNGRLVVPNVGDIEDGGLPSETVFDGWEWRDRWEEIEHQSDQAVSNYDSEFVEALYDELDAGRLDPEDVRGAEGMARYLSGDSDVTDQRFRLALMQMSGMTNPDLAGSSSMTVEYEGYTDVTFNGTDGGERAAEFSGYTEDTFEGLLFATEVPEGGFEVNQTYTTNDDLDTDNISDLEPVDGSAQIFDSTEGETTHFHKGNFTVTAMYDTDGEQVETVDWDEPQYDTYNASEFAEYIEEVQDLRDAIADDSADDGLSIGLPDWDLDDVETSEALVGLVIIVVVAMAIIGLVTDLLPWF